MKLKNLYWQPIVFKKPISEDEHDFLSKFKFLGCLHYNHRCDSWENGSKLWQKRTIAKTVEEYNDILIRRMCSCLSHEDTFFLLGDNVFGANGEKSLMDILLKIPFKTLFLMPGNHHAGYKQLLEKTNLIDGVPTLVINENKVVHFVPNYLEIIIQNQFIVLSHYPILSWNEQANGSWMVHSHCHGTLMLNRGIGDLYYKAKAIDVGFEIFQGPVGFPELQKHFNAKSIVTFDHHK